MATIPSQSALTASNAPSSATLVHHEPAARCDWPSLDRLPVQTQLDQAAEDFRQRPAWV